MKAADRKRKTEEKGGRKRKAAEQVETHLQQLNSCIDLIHRDISAPHCLLHSLTAGINRLWITNQRRGKSMDYARLKKLLAYVLAEVAISNFCTTAQAAEQKNDAMARLLKDDEFQWVATVPFPKPLSVAKSLFGLALETRAGQRIRRSYSAEPAKPLICAGRVKPQIELEIALSYCYSREMAKWDGGPTHIWAASIVFGMSILALELSSNAPCVPGIDQSRTPHFACYNAWTTQYTATQTRRQMRDPIPLGMLQARQAIGVTHVGTNHWHHLRHRQEQAPLGARAGLAPNAWEERQPVENLPGNSAAAALNVDAIADGQGGASNLLPQECISLCSESEDSGDSGDWL